MRAGPKNLREEEGEHRVIDYHVHRSLVFARDHRLDAEDLAEAVHEIPHVSVKLVGPEGKGDLVVCVNRAFAGEVPENTHQLSRDRNLRGETSPPLLHREQEARIVNVGSRPRPEVVEGDGVATSPVFRHPVAYVWFL